MIGLYQITGDIKVWLVDTTNGRPTRWHVPDTGTLNVFLTGGWRVTPLAPGSNEANAMNAFPVIP